MPTKGEGEVIVEMRPVGSVVRVAAIDVATGTEVVVMGPASASQQTLEQVAIAKLRRKLAMDKGS
jgi:ABC-type Zn2+ transport system substrate-binding protein/surface adhesin